ncbi:MAG: M23 family metallopeptidase [Methylotenera sp.]|nr:M23 family metallopeptidase [Methylotenera sp.]
MNIIFVSNSMAKARTLSVLQVSMIALALVLVPIFITLLLIEPQDAAEQRGMKALLPAHLKFSFINPQKHLDAYAIQLGDMQARIMRLDAQSERLSKLAGEKVPAHSSQSSQPKPDLAIKNITSLNNLSKPLAPSVSSKPLPAYSGGPLVRDAPLSEADLQRKIAELTAMIDFQTEHLSELEAKLLQQSVLKDTLPNNSPILAAYNSSSFGWRLDPFNGHKAFHEGLDFPANIGDPIYAAADGIVSASEQTPDYGKLVKIDHGSGLETRYAHASKLLVKVGERVEKGQKIAEVGNTGRSTGPHLHYEIRLNGNALDPRKYLKASS